MKYILIAAMMLMVSFGVQANTFLFNINTVSLGMGYTHNITRDLSIGVEVGQRNTYTKSPSINKSFDSVDYNLIAGYKGIYGGAGFSKTKLCINGFQCGVSSPKLNTVIGVIRDFNGVSIGGEYSTLRKFSLVFGFNF